LARLFIVSNRVSVPSRETAGRAGGLEVAVRATLRRRPGVWFGWSGKSATKDGVATRSIERDGLTYIVTDLVKEDYQEYYNGFANRVLWPILHYRLDLAEFSRRDHGGYMRVNEHFASELHKVLQADDVVWVQDYHLLPLANALRERGHANKIGFFLHIPVPPPEILTALPNHERLIPALCHYDLVGLQTEGDAENFARYLIKEIRMPSRDWKTFYFAGRAMRIGVFPVGVDTAELQALAGPAMRTPFVRSVVESLGGRAMIIGVDRLDYSKGIPQRMQAFERFLAAYPEWRNKVTYLQITPKSRSEIREYAEIEQTVSSTAGRINGAFGDASWTPIRYVNRTHGRSALAGLYRAARVGLVTPIRDGMNLVAKEYVASQDPADPGVLILSRFAGAAVECEAAILVNPYDPEAVGAAIARALAMALEERRTRNDALMRVLAENDITTWGERFLDALVAPQEEVNFAAVGGALPMGKRVTA
jgi:trehalose 6-phosphate synthase